MRSNFALTIGGNVLFAASQWAVLSLIAKLGDSEMLGRYALALAIVSPVMFFSHMNLRAVLATDVERQHSFGDYVAVRAGTTALGLAAVMGIVLAARYPRPLALLVLLMGAVLSADNLSDICYGAMQRRERMEQIARSMIARGVLSAAGMGVALWLTHSLLAGAVAMALGRVAVLVAHDAPVAAAGEPLAWTGVRAQGAIFRAALPLGLSLAMISLITNLPRYIIEQRLGTAALGVFAAVATFPAAGSTVVNALGQAATPRLATYFSSVELHRFRRLAWQLGALACALGACGVLGAWALGDSLLSLLYRPSFAAYSSLLVWVMAAGILSYIAGTLGYVITSARAFNAQAPLCAVAAAGSGIAAWLLVPRLGLYGAAAAVSIAWLLQIGGELLVLRRALRQRESIA